MSSFKNPFHQWWRIKEEIDLLLTVHNKFPKIVKRARGIMSKIQLSATLKLGKRAEKVMADCDKKKVKTITKFGKDLSPRRKEVKDSLSILKAIMKADFPEEYRRVFGRKK